MIGLFGIFGDNVTRLKTFRKTYNDNCNYKVFKSSNSYISVNSLKQFEDDKLFYDDQEWTLVFDGVLLNKDDIFEQYRCCSIEECLKKGYLSNNINNLINDFRGSFYGIIYYKIEDRFLCFTDHWSNKPIFYFEKDGYFIISSEVKEISSFLSQNHISYKLNLNGAYSLVSYAYMYEDNTLIEGVWRLQEGSILDHSSRQWHITKYHEWEINDKSIQKKDALEYLDGLFMQAISRQFNKNKEYGYKNIIPLSAGLDCRIVCYAARRLGIEDVLTFTYSETGEDDAVIPSKMAKNLRYQWIFKSLDNGLDLYNVLQSIKLSDGLIYYPWISQLNTFLECINMNNVGVIHTGVIGDVIVGSFLKSLKDVKKKYKLGDGAYSQKLIDKIQEERKEQPYEIGMFRNRAINGACLGYSTSFRQYGEAVSPFMDVDFAKFCFSLPIEYRIRHELYYEWVSKKFPEASRFPHNGIKIPHSKIAVRLNGKRYYLETIFDLFRNTLKAKFVKSYGMNPMEYWFQNNVDLKNVLDNFFLKNREVLNDFTTLYEDITNLYAKGTALEKTMVISLIGSYKYLFMEEEL